MSLTRISKCLLIVAAATAAAEVLTQPASAQTGRFLAVLNENNNDANGDGQRTVLFFDADALASGPLFAVYMGFEGTSSSNSADGSTIAVDPVSGDIYFTEFDDPGSPSPDTVNDLDLYRVEFTSVLNHWTTNFKGQNVRTLTGPLAVGGIAPTNGVPANPPGSIVNSTNQDFITYGVQQAGAFNFRLNHSNTFVLPGSIAKIGEVKRNNSANPSPFFQNSLEFLDNKTLILLDDSAGPDTTESLTTDHQFRFLEQASTTPGGANGATVDFLDGGYNSGTAESWNSRRAGFVNLDVAGHSEPETMAYYRDSVSGVRGVWITESDGVGDDIAFMQIDASNNTVGYRPLSTGAPSFALDNDPFTSTTTNDGKADNIHVDKDTGDVIIMESGFGDLAAGIGPEHEPAVLRLDITSYDNGSGQIGIGSWSQKVILTPPTKSTGDTGFLERGQWTAWDSENDRVFIVNPGSGTPESPQFGMDIWVIDMKVGSPTYGQTTSFLDLDDSVSLFNTDSYGDKVVFFNLAPTNNSDFNNDGQVDGDDFLVWQRGLGTPAAAGDKSTGDANGDLVVNGTDLQIWRDHYNLPPVVAAAAGVPEPASMALVLCGLVGLAARRRRN